MMEQEIGDNEIGGGSVKKVYVESLERDTIFFKSRLFGRFDKCVNRFRTKRSVDLYVKA